MKITILGASHGVPEANRKCSCTMLETCGRYYFIDMGILPFEELNTRNIPAEAVKGVFLTHMHGDHSNGLVSFVDLASWHFKSMDPVIFLPDLRAVDGLKFWLEVNGTEMRPLRFEEVHEGLIFDDGFLKVTAVPTKHCPHSHAYLAEAEGKAVLFTGDLKVNAPSDDFPEIAKTRPTDLMICEAAHFPATEYVPILSQCPTKKVCINHYVPWNIPNVMQLGKELDPVPVILANDNMEFIL